MTKAEVPPTCDDPECIVFFSEMFFLRSHIKLEHLSRWSSRHSNGCANSVDVEIPKEMSQFADLKTLTENVGPLYRAREWRKTDQWREGEAGQEQRSTTSKRGQKHSIGEGANEEMEDELMDLISQAARDCTWYLLRSTAIVTEMPTAGRAYNDLVTKQPAVVRGSPHVWFFTSVLRGTVKESLGDQGQCTDRLRPGEGGSGQDDSQGQQPQEVVALGRGVQTLPNVRARVAYMPLEEVLATQGDTRRMPTQELIRHIRILCRAKVHQCRAPCGQQLLDAPPKAEKERQESRADGDSGVSAFSQRLVKIWRDRRECISAPPIPISERETDLVASLIKCVSR